MRIQHYGRIAKRREKRGEVTIKLLVSLVHPSECEALLRHPPDIIDIKNPSDGSLGMPDIETIKAIRARTTGLPLSVAIGDARNDARFYGARAVAALNAGAEILKVGLFGFDSKTAKTEFLASLKTVIEDNGFSAPIVVAGYADRMDNEMLDDLTDTASSAGIAGCMLDTYEKRSGRLTDHLNITQLERFIGKCREKGLMSALAGGLNRDDAGWLLSLDAGVAGFRGAVALGERDEPGIDAERLTGLIDTFRAKPVQPALPFS